MFRGNYICATCGGLADVIGLQPSGVRFCDCRNKIKTLRADLARVTSERNEEVQSNVELREKLYNARNDNDRLREAVGEVIRQYKCLDSQSWKSDPSPLHFAIAAAEAALKGDS